MTSPLAAKAGVPQGYPLRRFAPGKPPLEAPVVLGGEGRLRAGLARLLEGDYHLIEEHADTRRAGVVFDATGLNSPQQLRELYDFFHPQLAKLAPNARLLIIGTDPASMSGAAGVAGAASTQARIAARALEGFSRSLAKEMRKGATVNLVWTDAAASATDVEATVRFFLSGKSAFVDGQVVRVAPAAQSRHPRPESWEQPLAGRVAVVTGAARGIGATIAEVLAREGAEVICIDVPQASEQLSATANKVKGTALSLDVTEPQAAQRIAEHARARYGVKYSDKNSDKHSDKSSGAGVIDILVHNAGITRDKLLYNMSPEQWDAVLAVNLLAPVRITEELMEAGHLAQGASVIGVSSMAGISGNRGQTNYATTKAGIIGLVESLAEPLAQTGATINAVAPGFIETAMTAVMPFGPREIGRRLNSLQQAGLPVDVAETVAFFAAAPTVTGNTVRVCGQNLMGA
ncbi:3-oxoacyl-ACP reductase [Corynebacterium sp.]|uniref:3-oxoacyl-ACP reductase n=1 Tax=Corynebacterium sp. TaxID=1720 RepID=UPI0026DAB81C|nr:3-oxoacyl-ACP reductase [Corynebacterium sp.]MDO5032445.1 3-oxoacyl-ACP reductase [Corynebacterium sp.]